MRDVTGYNSRRITTSRIEVRDILVSALVLSAAFALMFGKGGMMDYFQYHFGDMKYVAMFGIMFMLVVLSFIGHELAHKAVAQKYGMWSEYRMYPFGLVLAIVMSLVGFLIAAPGAVMIRGDRLTEEENGRISIAGPLVNIVLSLMGIVGCLALNHSAFVVPLYLLMAMNASLALFNLIPIPPLDGSKVFAWRTEVWAACIAMAAMEFATVVFFMPDLYWA